MFSFIHEFFFHDYAQLSSLQSEISKLSIFSHLGEHSLTLSRVLGGLAALGFGETAEIIEDNCTEKTNLKHGPLQKQKAEKNAVPKPNSLHLTHIH